MLFTLIQQDPKDALFFCAEKGKCPLKLYPDTFGDCTIGKTCNLAGGT